MVRAVSSSLMLAALMGCERTVAPDLDAPTNLTYRLDPSGNPDSPRGVLLEWDGVDRADLNVYRIYSRAATGAAFDLRASTTSTSFHDSGEPDVEYYTTAVYRNGDESGRSNTIRIDERMRLARPASLTSVSLDGAVHLVWPDNAYTSRPGGFRAYRVYSTSYSLDQNLCGGTWSSEGTTISPQFLATNLTNGVPRCFAVSAESVEGFESSWSPLRSDTPRPDSRNVLVFAYQADTARSGFRFFQDLNGDGVAARTELGLRTSGNRTDIDFWVYRALPDTLFFVPERAGTTIALYDDVPVEDLTSIDIAPSGSAFSRGAIQIVPGYGYVFQMAGNDQYARYGAIRVTHVSKDYFIFDWSYQTDPGNPELVVVHR